MGMLLASIHGVNDLGTATAAWRRGCLVKDLFGGAKRFDLPRGESRRAVDGSLGCHSLKDVVDVGGGGPAERLYFMLHTLYGSGGPAESDHAASMSAVP